MKNNVTLILLVIGVFLTSQVFAQVESKTQGTSTTVTKSGSGSTKSSTGTVSSSKSSSSPLKMYDATGKLIYTVDKMGYVRNAKNRLFFQFTSNGEIIKKRVVIGTASGGIIKDRNGKEYARLAQGGKVLDAGGKPIGAVKDDGIIIDNKGTKIGSAPGVEKYIAVMIYFYKDVLENSTTKTKM